MTARKHRYAIDFITRNLWIPIVATAIVALANNMEFVANYLGVNDLRLFSYDYAIRSVNKSLTILKDAYTSYIMDAFSSAECVTIADMIIAILTGGHLIINLRSSISSSFRITLLVNPSTPYSETKLSNDVSSIHRFIF